MSYSFHTHITDEMYGNPRLKISIAPDDVVRISATTESKLRHDGLNMAEKLHRFNNSSDTEMKWILRDAGELKS